MSMMNISAEDKSRQEYPEVSYGVIEEMVNGMLGLYVDASKTSIETMPHLTNKTEWVQINNIPILQSKITVKHLDTTATTLTHLDGKTFKWKAGFPGLHQELIVDGKSTIATTRNPIRSRLFLGYCSNREWKINNHSDETTLGLFQCPRKF